MGDAIIQIKSLTKYVIYFEIIFDIKLNPIPELLFLLLIISFVWLPIHPKYLKHFVQTNKNNKINPKAINT